MLLFVPLYSTPRFVIGVYNYETPAEVIDVFPSSIILGTAQTPQKAGPDFVTKRATDILVIGNNFINSPLLSCLLCGIEGQTTALVQGRWMSDTMVRKVLSVYIVPIVTSHNYR